MGDLSDKTFKKTSFKLKLRGYLFKINQVE